MLKLTDYKTLYHMIIASMFALMLNLWVQDYVEKGIIFDMETFFWCFSNPQQTFLLWGALFISSYISVCWVYYCHKTSVSPTFSVVVHSL